MIVFILVLSGGAYAVYRQNNPSISRNTLHAPPPAPEQLSADKIIALVNDQRIAKRSRLSLKSPQNLDDGISLMICGDIDEVHVNGYYAHVSPSYWHAKDLNISAKNFQGPVISLRT
jgi:hypothetical protein